MKTTSNLQTASLVVFIFSLIISVLFYLSLYLLSLSKPVHIRILFTIASVSGTAFVIYGFSSLLGTPVSWLGKAGLLVTGLHFIFLLYTIWSNASFLANNWLLPEISIAIILLTALAAWLYSRYANQ
jgi:hypothetical protein